MKGKKVFLCVLSVLLLAALLGGFTLRQAPSAFLAASGTPLKFSNCAYPAKVMNVYSDYAPSQGNSVTLWSGTGSRAQTWAFGTIANSAYAHIRSYDQPHLALNYNLATTKCTLWPWAVNTPSDCEIYLADGNTAGSNRLELIHRGRNLGTSGSGNGAQLYWYFGETAEENWFITYW